MPMHPDETPMDEGVVRQLLQAQHPQWADLAVRRVASSGTDNALYRLGEELVVRLPRIGWAVDDVAKEQRWLPVLAPHLPLEVPAPVARGVAGEGYPWDWSVYGWVAGEHPGPDDDLARLARDLAGFVRALQAIDTSDGPTPGPSGRGVPLTSRDTATREALTQLGRLGVLPDGLEGIWHGALAADPWDRPPVWVHGDLTPGNLLARDGRLSAVIDFGSLNVGDPAVDLLVAWNLLNADARETYRRALGVDDATWQRGRGWALSVAVVALPYYLHTNPAIVASSWHVLRQLLAAEA